jgi:CHC2 zinc finger
VLQLEQANRRLAYALGGDLASVDAARILRPPSSWNHKCEPPAPVELIALDPVRQYDAGALIDGLADPPGPPVGNPARGPRTGRTEIDRLLLAIPAAEYVRAIAGVSPNRAGKVHCPFHDLSVGETGSDGDSPGSSLEDASLTDRVAQEGLSGSAVSRSAGASSDPLRSVPPPVYFERLTGLRVGRSGKLRCLFHDDRVPSLHVYREPERGWYCFGCRRGGSIYDLAALLSGRSTRGSDFLELRRELESLFL